MSQINHRSHGFRDQGSNNVLLILGKEFQARRRSVVGHPSIAFAMQLRVRKPALNQCECPVLPLVIRSVHLRADSMSLALRDHRSEGFAEGGGFLRDKRLDGGQSTLRLYTCITFLPGVKIERLSP